MREPGAPAREAFPSTHWSEVGRAGATDVSAAREALASLLRRYLPAMKVHLTRKRRLGDDEADELLQDFVADKVLDRRFVAAADARRGRFRSFLLTSLDHFLVDRVRARRPAPSPLADDGDEAAAHAPADPFDVAWAREVIHETLRRMEEACRGGGRADVWAMFEWRVVGPTLLDRPAPPYDALVASLGFATPTQASNCLVTAKRMFARTLRAVVTEYAGEAANVEAELRDLTQILSRGRAGSC
jgi:DNA-directed RNA polymerase specialized sigma24 family protein